MSGVNLFTQAELLTCSLFNFKMFLFTLTFIICISCICSCLLPSPTPTESCSSEHFSNNDFFSYRDTINPGYFTYQHADLTSKDNSLIAGQANMYVTKDGYILDIHCNLYILNGNPFGQKLANTLDNPKIIQKYLAYIKSTRSGDRILIGQLIRDNDAVYKLKFISQDIKKYVEYNEIEIVYQQDKIENTILNGKFTIM